MSFEPVAQRRKPLRLLHLEDQDDDVEVAQILLSEAGFACEITRAKGRASFEASLSSGATYDLILADYFMSGYDGRAALAFARSVRPDIPFIVISGKIGEELAIEMLREGATDYVLKQRVGRLVPAVTRALRDRERERVREASEHVIRSLSERLRETSLLEVVLAQMPSGVLIAEAPSGEVVLANPRFAEILDLEPGSLRTLADLRRRLPRHADGSRYTLEELPPLRALETGASLSPEVMEYRDGRVRLVVAQATPVRAADGRVLAVVTTVTDATEQMRAEQERGRLLERVADEAALLRAVVEQMPAGLLLIGEQGAIRLANEAARAILSAHLAEGERLDQVESRLLRPGATTPLSEEERPVVRAVRQGLTIRSEELDVEGDGKRRTVIFNAAPVRDHRGQVVGGVSAFLDITDRKRLEAEAHEQVRLREQLLRVVSHDLRTPLSAIAGSTHVLLARDPEPKARKPLEVIALSAQRMERMIHDLLDFGQASSGGMRLNREPTDLRAIISRSIEEVCASRPEASIDLESERGPCIAAVDSDRMVQAFGNLLTNAIEHGEPRTPIRVALRRKGDYIESSVANAGKPIPAELLPHLFEPFRGTRKGGRGGGLGLGLFIVQQIVHAHGGTVEARSSAQEGTRMTIRMPALAAQAALEERQSY
ncbi:MAG: PAS domain-containing protein [Deltaproteobacteria bacterium]|nr:PAS domain-containing protein [Deltaproteobacteria bacterium]